MRFSIILVIGFSFFLITVAANSVSIKCDPFTYSNEYTDTESGLQYLKTRYYDPSLMRFVIRDNYVLMNRYSYGESNPIVNIDPTGHNPVMSLGFIVSLTMMVSDPSVAAEEIVDVTAGEGTLLHSSGLADIEAFGNIPDPAEIDMRSVVPQISNIDSAITSVNSEVPTSATTQIMSWEIESEEINLNDPLQSQELLESLSKIGPDSKVLANMVTTWPEKEQNSFLGLPVRLTGISKFYDIVDIMNFTGFDDPSDFFEEYNDKNLSEGADITMATWIKLQTKFLEQHPKGPDFLGWD